MSRLSNLVRCLGLAAAASAASTASAMDAGEGLTVASSPMAWERWQNRVSINSELPHWRANLNTGTSGGLQISGASLMSDYYFATLPLGAKGAGGFRATSGMLLGAGGSLMSGGTGSTWGLSRRSSTAQSYDPAADLRSTVPYVGLGYSGLTSREGWGFAADVGVMARSGSESDLRYGKSLGENQSLDELLRDLRLTPIVQLGVSYSF